MISLREIPLLLIGMKAALTKYFYLKYALETRESKAKIGVFV